MFFNAKRRWSLDQFDEAITLAAREVTAAQSDLATVQLGLAEGAEGVEGAAKESRAALEAARTKLFDLKGARQAAVLREQDDAAKARAADLAERRARSETLARRRSQVATEITDLAEKMAGKYWELMQATQDLREASPSRKPRRDLHELDHAGLEGAVRCELRRGRLMWAHDWPWGDESLPRLTDRVEAGNREALSVD